MDKTVSGDKNLNNMPRRDLMNWHHYVGQQYLPTVTGRRRYAGLLFENPQPFATRDTKIRSMRRQARPYGVF